MYVTPVFVWKCTYGVAPATGTLMTVKNVLGRPRLFATTAGYIHLPQIHQSIYQLPTVCNSMPSALHDNGLSLWTFGRRKALSFLTVTNTIRNRRGTTSTFEPSARSFLLIYNA